MAFSIFGGEKTRVQQVNNTLTVLAKSLGPSQKIFLYVNTWAWVPAPISLVGTVYESGGILDPTSSLLLSSLVALTGISVAVFARTKLSLSAE